VGHALIFRRFRTFVLVSPENVTLVYDIYASSYFTYYETVAISVGAISAVYTVTIQYIIYL